MDDLLRFRWNEYRLEDPWLLLLALLIPALILLSLVRRESRAVVAFTRLAAIRGHVGGVRRGLRWLPFAFRLLAVALLVFAIARPQRGQATAAVDAEGIDIVLAFDISGSMSTQDFSGRTRMQVAQEVLRRFIESRKDDRIGLVVFRADVSVLSPLTLDHNPLTRLVTTAPDLRIPDGTAVGMGTAEAANLLRDSRSQSRIVVVMTDGESNAGAIDPIPSARLAEAIGVRVYTIGVIGSTRNEVGAETLQQMADITGGQFHRATDAGGLAKIYEDIATLEKSRVTRDRFQNFDELAPYFFAAAIALLVLETLLRATAFRRIP